MRFFTIERVVTLLAPFFAAAASWIAGLVANNVPGAPQLDPHALAAVMALAFVATIGIVAKWLHGRQLPSIAGLHLTDAQLQQIRMEVASYLISHGEDLKSSVAEIERVVAGYLRQRSRLESSGAPPPGVAGARGGTATPAA